MTGFLLIRHGETDAVGKVLAGRVPGWSLNPRGEQQVQRLAKRLSSLPIHHVYSSPLERALATARPIAIQHGLVPEVVEDFDEIVFGEWEGMSFEDLQARDDWRRYNVCRTACPPPGGESLQNVQTRMIRGIECLNRHHSGDLVAIVSHGDPLRVAIAHCLGLPLDHLSRFELSPASVSAVAFTDAGARLLYLNETGDPSF
jgi:broad specificity phosphatase PhoE